MGRRKISAAYNDFIEIIGRLERLNNENQTKFSISGTHSGPVRLSKQQLFILTESIFFNGYRAYENFLRDIFLLYCLEKKPKTGDIVESYLKPKDFDHAESLIQSAMPFLDWSSPSNVITRSEIYLSEGFPIKTPITSNKSLLTDYKRIRNHIAHNSKESLLDYKKTLVTHLNTIPLSIPSAGEFLLMKERRNAHKYKLITFFELMRKIANDLT
jgi:hypothetical protein